MSTPSDSAGMIIVYAVMVMVPPLGVLCIAGCGADFWLNIILWIFGGIPGIVHGVYLAFVYYDHKQQGERGYRMAERAPFIFSERVQRGGGKLKYLRDCPPNQPRAQLQGQPEPQLQSMAQVTGTTTTLGRGVAPLNI